MSTNTGDLNFVPDSTEKVGAFTFGIVVVVVVDAYASIVVDVLTLVVVVVEGSVVETSWIELVVVDVAAFVHIYIADTTSESIIPSLVALA